MNKKKAGLPLWAWGVIGVAALYFWYRNQQSSSSSSTTTAAQDPNAIDPATGYTYGQEQTALENALAGQLPGTAGASTSTDTTGFDTGLQNFLSEMQALQQVAGVLGYTQNPASGSNGSSAGNGGSTTGSNGGSTSGTSGPPNHLVGPGVGSGGVGSLITDPLTGFPEVMTIAGGISPVTGAYVPPQYQELLPGFTSVNQEIAAYQSGTVSQDVASALSGGGGGNLATTLPFWSPNSIVAGVAATAPASTPQVNTPQTHFTDSISVSPMQSAVSSAATQLGNQGGSGNPFFQPLPITTSGVNKKPKPKKTVKTPADGISGGHG